MQINDPQEGWSFYDPDHYDDSWMTPEIEKQMSEELLVFLEANHP
jgi:hypothetical protein